MKRIGIREFKEKATHLVAGIWTEDRDSFGSGLAIWHTPVLQHCLVETP